MPERERKKHLRVHEKMTHSSKLSAKRANLLRQLQVEDEAQDMEARAEAELTHTFRDHAAWTLTVTKERRIEPQNTSSYIDQKRQMFLLQRSLERDAALFDEFLRDNDCSSVQAMRVLSRSSPHESSPAIPAQEDTDRRPGRSWLAGLGPASPARPPPPSALGLQGLELYFTEPQELLDVFTDLEEQNLSLIQNTQEMEETMRDLGRTLRPNAEPVKLRVRLLLFAERPNPPAARRSGEPVDAERLERGPCPRRDRERGRKLLCRARPPAVKTKAASEHDLLDKAQEEMLYFFTLPPRPPESRSHPGFRSSGDPPGGRGLSRGPASSLSLLPRRTQDKLLESLNSKVLDVYRNCVGPPQEASLGTVQMLTVIEHQLDELLENLEHVPPARIEQAEKAKEKERRLRHGRRKGRMQKQLQEERLLRAQCRAKARDPKKRGRKLLCRARPPAVKTKAASEHDLLDKAQEEMLYFFT
nr:cilia- and flagella-associated protein 100-like [Microcebus murinus]